jgi:predicted nucleic acid-binding protein
VELLRRSRAGRRIARLIRGGTLAAPAHLDVEVLSALARLAREDPREEPLVQGRLASLTRAPITRYPCSALLTAAWRLRTNVSARDAPYVALSRRLGAELVTGDRGLAEVPLAVLGVRVHLVR